MTAVLDIDRLLGLVRAQSTSLRSVFHGEEHWCHVASLGLDLAEETGADPVVVVAFAVLHDSMRIGDDDDPLHGARAGELVRTIGLGAFGLGEEQIALVERACRGHTGGTLSDDPTIGTCWDADRMTLWRVGTRPSPRYMSTPVGRRMATAARAAQPRADWPSIAARLASRVPIEGA
jgi:uncharacterized protein